MRGGVDGFAIVIAVGLMVIEVGFVRRGVGVSERAGATEREGRGEEDRGGAAIETCSHCFVFVLGARSVNAGTGRFGSPQYRSRRLSRSNQESSASGFFARVLSSDASRRATFFTSSAAGSVSGRIPRSIRVLRTAPLLLMCSFEISSSLRSWFSRELKMVISAAKSFALRMIVGAKSANGRLAGTFQWDFICWVVFSNKA